MCPPRKRNRKCTFEPRRPLKLKGDNSLGPSLVNFVVVFALPVQLRSAVCHRDPHLPLLPTRGLRLAAQPPRSGPSALHVRVGGLTRPPVCCS